MYPWALTGKKDRNSVLILLLSLLTGGLLGLLIFWFQHKDILSLSHSYLLAQALFLGYGILHCWLLYKKIPWARRDGLIREQDSFFPEAGYTLLSALALSLGLLLTLRYFLNDIVAIYWSAGFVFLLPFLLLKTFDFVQQIPMRDYQIKWRFSNQKINENEWNWTNEMWVSFEVKESWNKPGMNRSARFRILAPRNVPLGEIFRLAIREYNKQAQNVVVQDLGFEPENRGRYWWLFSLKIRWNRPHTWFPNLRYLDPGDSALVNALRPGDLVKVRRISTGKEQEANEIIAIGQAIP